MIWKIPVSDWEVAGSGAPVPRLKAITRRCGIVLADPASAHRGRLTAAFTGRESGGVQKVCRKLLSGAGESVRKVLLPSPKIHDDSGVAPCGVFGPISQQLGDLAVSKSSQSSAQIAYVVGCAPAGSTPTSRHHE